MTTWNNLISINETNTSNKMGMNLSDIMLEVA